MFRSLFALVHDTTITPAKSYYPSREDVSGFLNVTHTWWTTSNSKQRYSANPLANAVVLNNNKTNFFRLLSFWIHLWSISHYFTLTPTNLNSFDQYLAIASNVIDELLNNGYYFVLTARLQSDPIECHFSHYRQMSGGRFLVSLREEPNTEWIFSCRSLIKKDINFWKEDLQPESNEDESYEMIDERLRD